MGHVADVIVRIDDGLKEQAEQLAGAMGLSLNKYIIRLITADVSSMSDEERELLAKMKTRSVHITTESRETYTVSKKNKKAA